tara:strand:- start:304 stop:558 length:255 start_codon:yes stop_codon:yes gene_type:complete
VPGPVEEVDFVIRLRSNHWIETTDTRRRHLALNTRRQKKNTTWHYENTLRYGRLRVHIVCHRPAKGERLFLATHRADLSQVVSF